MEFRDTFIKVNKYTFLSVCIIKYETYKYRREEKLYS